MMFGNEDNPFDLDITDTHLDYFLLLKPWWSHISD